MIAWRATLTAALDAIFPPRCGGEHAAPLAARPRHGLCRSCTETLEANLGRRCPLCDLPTTNAGSCAACERDPPPFVAARAPYLYGGALAELVVACKFHGREDLASALGRLLADDAAARELARGASCCVPVPLGAARRAERGFNQSAIMARVVGRAWGIPVRHALRRVRETAAQSSLELARRRRNVEGAFVARRRLSGRVLLVDDVVTTGETARQAAAALLAGGAAEVVLVAAARSV